MRTARVERELGAGDVRRHGVHVALGDAERHPRAHGEEQCRREPRQRGQHLTRHRLLGLLEPSHLRPDGGETLGGVDDPDRELGEHRRDTVVVDAVLVGHSHRHGHERAHAAAFGFLVARHDEIAEAVGEHGEHDVVHGAAERGAHALHVGEVRPRPVPPPVRSDRAIERRHHRRTHESGHRRDTPRRVAEQTRELTPATRRGAHGAELLVRARDQVADGLAHEAHVRRLRFGPPGVRGRLRRLALRVEQDRQQVGPRYAVDHAVVHLRDERPVTVLQALDHPHLPQRLRAVELLGHEPADEVAELAIAARRRQRGVAEVIAEVEMRVVHPERPAEVQRDEPHPLAVTRHERELPGDQVGEVAVLRSRALEDPHRPDVHVVDVVLDVEERGVERAHAIHRGPSGRTRAEGTASESATDGSRPQ